MTNMTRGIILALLSLLTSISLQANPYRNKPINDSNLLECMRYYKIDNPKWVIAQAKLETGHYKSKVFKKHHNLFGLYDSKNKRYHRFKHWSYSVKAYKEFIQGEKRYDKDKYNEQNYHKYLLKIGYASDKEYIQKLRNIKNRKNDGN